MLAISARASLRSHSVFNSVFPLCAALMSVIACPQPGGTPAPDAGGGRDGGRTLDSGNRGGRDGGGSDARALFDAGSRRTDSGTQLDSGASVDSGADADSGSHVDAGAPVSGGDLDVAWIHGSANCDDNTDVAIQVHAYRDDTYILRQNPCVHFEAPFMYLLMGDDAAFLQDTGATSGANTFPLRETVETLLTDWLTARGRTRASMMLFVTHSHSHGDHVAADGQFVGQPQTTVVGTTTTAVRDFFGIASWPNDEVSFDLGGRVLDVVGIPGHQNQSIAVFDRRSKALLTGDSLYAGNLFIGQWDTYRDSIARLRAFAETRDVEDILGTHIEMTDTPGVVYPYPNVYQPDEHALQLDLTHLVLLDDTMGAIPQCHVLDDFIINPGGC